MTLPARLGSPNVRARNEGRASRSGRVMVNHVPAGVLEHEHVGRRQVRGLVVASLVADDDGRLSDDADGGAIAAQFEAGRPAEDLPRCVEHGGAEGGSLAGSHAPAMLANGEARPRQGWIEWLKASSNG
jgi:hypothetical protein